MNSDAQNDGEPRKRQPLRGANFAATVADKPAVPSATTKPPVSKNQYQMSLPTNFGGPLGGDNDDEAPIVRPKVRRGSDVKSPTVMPLKDSQVTSNSKLAKIPPGPPPIHQRSNSALNQLQPASSVAASPPVSPVAAKPNPLAVVASSPNVLSQPSASAGKKGFSAFLSNLQIPSLPAFKEKSTTSEKAEKIDKVEKAEKAEKAEKTEKTEKIASPVSPAEKPNVDDFKSKADKRKSFNPFGRSKGASATPKISGPTILSVPDNVMVNSALNRENSNGKPVAETAQVVANPDLPAEKVGVEEKASIKTVDTVSLEIIKPAFDQATGAAGIRGPPVPSTFSNNGPSPSGGVKQLEEQVKILQTTVDGLVADNRDLHKRINELVETVKILETKISVPPVKEMIGNPASSIKSEEKPLNADTTSPTKLAWQDANDSVMPVAEHGETKIKSDGLPPLPMNEEMAVLHIE